MDDRIAQLEARVADLEKGLSIERRKRQFFTVTDLVALFGYNSSQALMYQVDKGTFPIPLMKITHDPARKPGQRKPGKKNMWVASAEVVRQYFADVHTAQLQIYEDEFRKGILDSGTL